MPIFNKMKQVLIFLTLLLFGARAGYATQHPDSSGLPLSAVPVTILPASVINVLTFKKVAANSSAKPSEVPECTTWKLSKVTIAKLLKGSKLIDGPTRHYEFSVLPCAYEGYVEIDKKRYWYNVNSGACFMITGAKETVYYGCYNPALYKYFLDTPYKGDEE